MPPDVVRVTEPTGQIVDRRHRRMERETGKIDMGWENGVVASMEVCQDTRSRVHDGEIVESVEEAGGGYHCELLQPLHNHHLATADIDTTDEDIETV